MVGVDAPEVDLRCDGDCQNRIRHARNLGDNRVEKRAVLYFDAAMDELRLECRGQRVGALRDVFQPLRTMINGVHRRHHGQQDLGGTNVRGRLVAADVLLARLKG